jgi:type IV pilus assembly protein PilN
VLQRSLFLNSLLYAKGISWTRLFNDLEKVMPHNVRLISIRPQANSQNEVLLDMVVGAESAGPVIRMLTELENSPVFGATMVHNYFPPSQSEPLMRYRVSVSYVQKL